MPRWKWHLTRTGQPYPPDAIGPATDYPGRTGAYSREYLDRAQREAEERRGGEGREERPE